MADNGPTREWLERAAQNEDGCRGPHTGDGPRGDDDLRDDATPEQCIGWIKREMGEWLEIYFERGVSAGWRALARMVRGNEWPSRVEIVAWGDTAAIASRALVDAWRKACGTALFAALNTQRDATLSALAAREAESLDMSREIAELRAAMETAKRRADHMHKLVGDEAGIIADELREALSRPRGDFAALRSEYAALRAFGEKVASDAFDRGCAYVSGELVDGKCPSQQDEIHAAVARLLPPDDGEGRTK